MIIRKLKCRKVNELLKVFKLVLVMFSCGKWMVGGMPFCCVPNTIVETGNIVRNKTDPGPALRERRVMQAEVRGFALASFYNHLSILLIYMYSQIYGFSSSRVDVKIGP